MYVFSRLRPQAAHGPGRVWIESWDFSRFEQQKFEMSTVTSPAEFHNVMISHAWLGPPPPPGPPLIKVITPLVAAYSLYKIRYGPTKSLVFWSSVRDAHLWAPKSISTHLRALTFGPWRAQSTHLLVHSTPAVVEWGQLGIYKAFSRNYEVHFLLFAFISLTQ
jgi:hypothetical protein